MSNFSSWVKAPPKASSPPQLPQPRHEKSVLISINVIFATGKKSIKRLKAQNTEYLRRNDYNYYKIGIKRLNDKN